MEGESSAIFTVGDDDDDDDNDDIHNAPFGQSLEESGLVMSGDSENSDLFQSTPLDLTENNNINNHNHGTVNGNAMMKNMNSTNEAEANIPPKYKNENHDMNQINSGMNQMQMMDDPLMTASASASASNNPHAPSTATQDLPVAPTGPSPFYRNHEPFTNTNASHIHTNQTYSQPQKSSMPQMPIHSNTLPNQMTNHTPQQHLQQNHPIKDNYTYTSNNDQDQNQTVSYESIQVGNPRFFSSSSLFSKTSGGYWIYQITTTFSDRSVVYVHRRFSHFVSLEDRLKEACPGSILPLRPEKTNTLDESRNATQSPKFAQNRAIELENYLNTLASHPYASIAPPLHFFLTIPEIGAIWHDVSESTMTRLSAIGSKAVLQFGEKTTKAVKLVDTLDVLSLEEDPEMIALFNSESLRLDALEKNIPTTSFLVKTTMYEYAELLLALGMEASKCSKNVKVLDMSLSLPFHVLAASLLRDGRVSKRTCVQLAKLLTPYLNEHKRIANVRSAMEDRKKALIKLYRAKSNADYCASKLLREQTKLLSAGKMEQLNKLEDDTQRSDEFVSICEGEVQDVGDILKEEVARVSDIRRRGFLEGLKGLATEWRECAGERKKLWEGAKKLMKEQQ